MDGVSASSDKEQNVGVAALSEVKMEITAVWNVTLVCMGRT
jgi:hypothetical protein